MRSHPRRWSRPFEDEEETGSSGEPGIDSTNEPDYAFEGYSVDFLDKVALMPVTRPAVTRSVKA